MQTKYKVLIIIAVGATGVAIGRYTVPIKTVTETKIVEVEKKVSDTKTDDNKKRHKDTTVVVVKNKDGSETTTTKVIEDTDSTKITDVKEKENTTIDQDVKKLVEKTGSRLNISVLAGAPVSLHGLGNFVYGVHVSRDLIGPISVGLFGLSDGVVGGSIGLTF